MSHPDPKVNPQMSYLEYRGQAIALLVENERPIFHPTGSEEANVASTGELLRSAPRGVVGGWGSTNWTYRVKMVGNE
jgi:hypothetical protein